MDAARAEADGKDPQIVGLFAEALTVFEATADWLKSPERKAADHD